MYKIVKKERLNDVVELMEVHAPMVARKLRTRSIHYFKSW
mgnify:CR=1 FL=1